ncbi:Multidrug resistance-associated protein 4, variant 2 [Dermatophagoides farinae]|uniref:Multidrug resistance-associated protein 4, variant 2 n=1 Tax=Dermatophagoides farinae TaxID=6954 RepID=A0A922I282_DERFA|nr:Multidrug resistance-associated protein 4, variant 2 [Dermatophagoides farinae]
MDRRRKNSRQYHRLMLFTFGNLGYQFQSIRLRSSFNIVKNILINVIATYGLSVYDPYDFIGENFSSNKFFITLLIFTYHILVPFSYLLITINYLIYGRQILHNIRTLIVVNFNRFYILFSIFIVVNECLFNGSFLFHFIFIERTTDLETYVNMFGWFQSDVQFHLSCFLSFIFQKSILHLLITIEHDMMDKRKNNDNNQQIQFNRYLTFENQRLLIQRLSRMASISKNVNQCLSFHLMIWLITQSFNLTLIFCIQRLSTDTASSILLLRIIVFCLYIAIISHYNLEISKQLKMIHQQLLSPYWNMANLHLNVFGIYSNTMMEERKLIQSFDPLRLYELFDMYEQDFLMKIYQLKTINFTFLMTLVFFITEYGVFIVQTNFDLDSFDHCARYDECCRLSDRLQKRWNRELERKDKTKISLLRALLKTFGWRHIRDLFFNCFIYGFLRMINPILLGRFIYYANLYREWLFSNDQNMDSINGNSSIKMSQPNIAANQNGLEWLDKLAISSTDHHLNALFYAGIHPYFMSNFRLGMNVRVALTKLIYDKSLRLSQSAIQRITIGKIVNLISTDASRLDASFTANYFIIGGPLHCIVAMLFLYLYIGKACLGALIIILLYLPFQVVMANILSRFRSKSILLTDNRLRLMAEILPAMRVIKMYCWEKPFAMLVNLARRLEIIKIRHSMILRSINLAIFFVSNKLIAFVCFVWFLESSQQQLTAEIVFVSLSLIFQIRESMTFFFPMAVSFTVESYISLCRIEKFLFEEEKSIIPKSIDMIPSISLKSVTVESESDGAIILNDISLDVTPGQLTVIVGQVGSGKSTILLSILGEYRLKSGTIDTSGSLIYASQESWIFSGTIRENILFGRDFDSKRYCKVIKVAALESDLDQMPARDQTIVEDRGTSLSGGQRARISLARALYTDSDCILLDDPLSAVDTAVAKHIFEKCIKKYLKNKVVILVTHQLQFIKQADQIVVLKNGACLAQGSYQTLLNKGIDIYKYAATEMTTDQSLPTSSSSNVDHGPEHLPLNQRKSSTSSMIHADSPQYVVRLNSFNSELFVRSRTSSLMSTASSLQDETSIMEYVNRKDEQINQEQYRIETTGTDSQNKMNSFKIYCIYFRTGAGFLLLSTFILSNVLTQVFFTGTDYWLSAWTDYQENLHLQNMDPNHQFDKSPIIHKDYDKNIIIYAFLVGLLFIFSIIRTTSFFTTCMRASVNLHNIIFTSLVKVPIMFFDKTPVGIIMNRVSHTARKIKRLEATARSPLFQQLAATLAGLPTIRSYGAQAMFTERFIDKQNVHSSVLFTFLSSSRLFGISMEIMCLVYIYCLIIFLILNLDVYTGSLIGLIISQSLSLTSTFNWGVRQMTEVETYMTSVERIIEFGKLDQENLDQGKFEPEENWPSLGDINFKDVCLYYNISDEPVLKNLMFKINGGEKIGIVGRTGAGKSSIITTLFRLMQPTGTIEIDGIDTEEISLACLRKQLSIIPQEPVLFSGNIRRNLDPFNEKSDEEIWNAIEKVELKSKISSLDSLVSECGNDFSVGQKQLICMARAILRKNRILILDEATANVDPRTDSFIQETIRTEFNDCTVLTIAHRLNTIIDYDRVIVLDKGRLMQFNTPYQLIQQGNGIFYELFQNLTTEIKNELKQMAKMAHYRHIKNDRTEQSLIIVLAILILGFLHENVESSSSLSKKSITIIIRDKFRYYQNTCTASYSNVWWQWSRWQREIDWMALHGINLPLAFNGQEIVYRRTFQRFNMSTKEIDDYFTGPAFLAWNRMGNIQTWSGPLSEHWHQYQHQLQLQILKRMRNFGMYPVVPGFAGHVSRHLKSHLKTFANISRLTDWNHTYFLEPEDPNFIKVGKVFVEEYIKLYGTDHFYNIDLFNEETPGSNDPAYLRKCSKNVYESISAADPQAIWIMQGWLFLFESSFWKQKQVEAFVTSVPSGRMIILDLFSEIIPVYQTFNGYYDQPFIWCMLHNFGGTHGMYGALNRINDELYRVRNSYKNFLGIGLTMEGIEQNDIVYDYMTETSWYDRAPDMIEWFSHYVRRRYGFMDKFLETELLDQAWQLLRISVYTDPIGIRNHGRYVITMVPKPGLHSQLSYNPLNLTEAVKLMVKFVNLNSKSETTREQLLSSETFVYDLVDMNRQALQLIFDYHYKQLDVAWIEQNESKLMMAMEKMKNILELMEQILQSSQHWLLYNWINNARSIANNSKERDYNEWQARNQITSWGPNDNIVDYAAKQWSGMFQYYYTPRWLFYFNYLQTMMAKNQTNFDPKQFQYELLRQIELPFTKATGQNLIQKANVSNLIANVNLVVKEIEQSIDHDDDMIEINVPIPYEYYDILSKYPFVLKRLLPQHYKYFIIIVDHHFIDDNGGGGYLDRFKIESIHKKQKIKITATTAVAAANGLHYYLKYVTNSSISWSGDQININIDDIPPMIDHTIEMTIREKFRYYQNACTTSYSMVWWQWNRWQRELDWMALHGINLALAFNGQEIVYRRTFQRFNLTIEEIDEYFTGPAYLAWNRMGNIQTWSGPLSEHWHQHQTKLQRKILKRMRELGMYPVVPGFSGHVPRAFRRKFPLTKMNRLANWNHFGANYSQSLFH